MAPGTAIAFWLSLASLFYVYVGFPGLLAIFGQLRQRRVRKSPITPTISLIIAAYNEAENIAERLDNALGLDYPAGALEIIVASDGSDDATEAIVASYAPRGVRLLRLPRRGKIHALNAAVAHPRGEILVFSDANSIYDREALRKLVRNFADLGVGGAAGYTSYLIRANSQSSSRGENLYWTYDTWLKQMESLTGNTVSAHGGMYAIRRELYCPLADPAVTDDFAISTGVIEQGRRLVFEPEARAYEIAVPEAGREFQRRVRLMTRGLRAVLLRKRLLNPFRYGFYSLVLFSHKVLRRLLPLTLIILLVSSAHLRSNGILYSAAFVGQILFYGLAAAGYFLKGSPLGQWKCFYVPFFYCMANAASLVALFKLIRGEKISLWQPQRHRTGAQLGTLPPNSPQNSSSRTRNSLTNVD